DLVPGGQLPRDLLHLAASRNGIAVNVQADHDVAARTLATAPRTEPVKNRLARLGRSLFCLSRKARRVRQIPLTLREVTNLRRTARRRLRKLVIRRSQIPVSPRQ